MNVYSEYKFIIVPVIAWFIAQFIKLIIVLITERKFDISVMVSMGGMPSSHSATVSALAVSIGKALGWTSPYFAIALFFALIVMYDAGGVRRTVGDQSAVLNKIIDELFKGDFEFEKRLKEFIGHSHIEIIIGALIGILLGYLLV